MVKKRGGGKESEGLQSTPFLPQDLAKLRFPIGDAVNT